MTALKIQTPKWSIPLLRPARYKFISGGRASGKSHERAEAVIENIMLDPDYKFLCIREVQKSLKFSAYQLIRNKIVQYGLEDYFDPVQSEIRRKGGSGIIVFTGMQDHTADSAKSFEGFDGAWFEEAQRCSQRSLEILRPTIRKDGSELWFTWNPQDKDDPVDKFCHSMAGRDDAVHVHVNYDQNPFLPTAARNEMLLDKEKFPDRFPHIWLGEYDLKKEEAIFRDKVIVEDFEIPDDPRYVYQSRFRFGLDFGFSQDPLAFVFTFIKDNRLYIAAETGGVGIEINNTPRELLKIPQCTDQWKIYADSARPEMISYLKNNNFNISPVDKWKEIRKDSIEYVRGFDAIVIHPSCKEAEKEFKAYSYKKDKHTGEILPIVEDKNDHYIDAVFYSLNDYIRSKATVQVNVVNVLDEINGPTIRQEY